jgi:hypothetical protein
MRYTDAADAYKKWERSDALGFPPTSKMRYSLIHSSYNKIFRFGNSD